jgi:hypothetical protein
MVVVFIVIDVLMQSYLKKSIGLRIPTIWQSFLKLDSKTSCNIVVRRYNVHAWIDSSSLILFSTDVISIISTIDIMLS